MITGVDTAHSCHNDRLIIIIVVDGVNDERDAQLLKTVDSIMRR